MTETIYAERDIVTLTREHIESMLVAHQEGTLEKTIEYANTHLGYAPGKVVQITGMGSQACILMTKNGKFTGAITHIPTTQNSKGGIADYVGEQKDGTTRYTLYQLDPSRILTKEQIAEYITRTQQRIEKEGYVATMGTSTGDFFDEGRTRYDILISEPGKIIEVPTNRLEKILGKGSKKEREIKSTRLGVLAIDVSEMPPFPVARWTLDYFAPERAPPHHLAYQQQFEKIQQIIQEEMPKRTRLFYKEGEKVY